MVLLHQKIETPTMKNNSLLEAQDMYALWVEFGANNHR